MKFLYYSLQPVKPTAHDYNVIMFKQNNRIQQLNLSVNLQYTIAIGIRTVLPKTPCVKDIS